MQQPINVLVLCTGNSARSILGEVLIRELGAGRFMAYSAGSQPAGKVNPGAIAKLREERHSVEQLRSKSWDEFSRPGAPPIDIVITVCDNAAGESCPVWYGAPITVHWGIADPAVDGDFDTAYSRLRRRVQAMIELPIEDMEKQALKAAMEAIHR